MTSTSTEGDTTQASPTFDQVVHALARNLYLSDCGHKGWGPYSYPYVDAGSIRRAKAAVDFLGYDDTVDLNA